MSLLMEWNEDANVRQLTDDGRKPESHCRRTTVRFIAGSGRTDAGGQWQLDLPNVVCEQIGAVSGVSFVATTTFDPRVDSIPRPSYAMTGNVFSGGHITLYVRTWDCRCEPAPDTTFDYHVAVAYDFVTQK